MPFKPSLVALKQDPTSAPHLGFPLTEIILEEPNEEGATTPFVASPDARDKITEAVTGSDVRVVRRSLSEVELEIDYINAKKKGLIERLYYDKRSIYLSPNIGRDTLISCPLLRSAEDFMGYKDFAGNHADTEYHWDQEEQVMRSWEADDPAITFNGHWTRFFRTCYGMDNEATNPHPTSTGTGWSFVTGSGTVNYIEEMLTPVLKQRVLTNQKGVTYIEAGQQSPSAAVIHSSTATLGTTTPIGASLLVNYKGSATFRLETSGGTLIDTLTTYGAGEWRMWKLRGNNPGSSTCRIKITLNDTASKDQTMAIGPVLIGNEGAAISDARVPDWADGTGHDTSDITASDSNEWVCPELTVSFFWKFAKDNYCGFLEIDGTSGLYFSYAPNKRIVVSQDGTASYFYNVDTEYSLVDGEWYHVVITAGHYGFFLYVNGVLHSDSGSFAYNAQKRGVAMRVGRIGSYVLLDSGMSHLRVDKRAWTQAEVLDHYHTYFSDHGRGAIEPTFMKELIIEDMEWEARVGSGSDQWLGKIVLRELGPEEDHAPMQRQEDM